MSRLPGPDHSAGSWNPLRAARPLFGLILLTTILLDRGGRLRRAANAQRHLPRGGLSADRGIVQAPGLAAKEVESPLPGRSRKAVSVVLGVIRVRSKSIRGAAEINVTFAAGTDMVQALNDVRARVAEVQSQFPPGTGTIVERQTPSIFPIIHFVVTGGGDPSALHDYAYYDLQRRIKGINDVSYVTVQGGDVREILVEVDPQRLVAAGLSLADVADRLGKEHRMKAVGRIDPGSRNTRSSSTPRPPRPADLENCTIGRKNGRPIRLRDIGRVVVSHADRTVAVRSDGQDAVALRSFAGWAAMP